MDVVVTGAGTGIGKEVAAHFAKSGARVVVTGRRREPLEGHAADIGAQAVVCDNADAADLARLAEVCADGVDVLVNNAGGNTSIGRADPESLADVADEWHANLRANVLTAVLTTAALEPLLRPDGRVVNIGSIAADAGAGSYGAAKAAVAAWTVDLARDLGGRGITVNTVSPGFIDGTEFFRGRMSDERREALRAATALGRYGDPADIAELVSFLASPGAGHITGQTLHVNGGAWTTR